MTARLIQTAIVAVPASDPDSPAHTSYRRAEGDVYWLIHLTDPSAGVPYAGGPNVFWSELAYVHDELCHVFVETGDVGLHPFRFDRIQDAEQLINNHGLTEVADVVLVKNRGRRG